MKHHVLETPNACLHYRKYGKGAKALLCFHGFGQDHDVYRTLEDRYGKQYTIFSFDLFYHGQSFWKDKQRPVSIKDWEFVVTHFLKEEKIDQFSLVGYSMGGRFALATFNVFPEKVEQLILLAPDGIKKQWLYWLMTSFVTTRNLLRYLVINPKPYQLLVNVLLKFHVINKGVLKFSETQMQTRAMRRRVYYSWTMFRNLYTPINVLVQNIKKNKVIVRCYMGDFDKVVPIENVKPLLRHFPKSLRHLPVGHTALLKTWIETNGAL